MNATPYALITLCWLVLFIYWTVSAIGAKRYARRNYSNWIFRLLIVAACIALFNSSWARHGIVGSRSLLAPEWLQWIGVVMCAGGIAFAIWARYYLGRNWGMPMSLKQDAELVTTGPYAYVRHPIYSGFMLAALGSTLVTLWWAVPLISFSAYFIFAARAEETIMLGEFGQRYADYRKRSKMLVPFAY